MVFDMPETNKNPNYNVEFWVCSKVRIFYDIIIFSHPSNGKG